MASREPSILIAESNRFAPQAAAMLEALGPVRFSQLGRGALIDQIAKAEVLWIRLGNYIDGEILRAAPNLRVIVSPTTGLNHIDLAEAETRGIRILSLRGEIDFLKEVRATAELTIGLMLALLRHIPEAARHVREGGWDRDLFAGNELYGKTVGVIGYGRLGRIVASLLLAFGCKVLAADPSTRKEDLAPGVILLSQEELLSQGDLVTIHVNLNEKNRGFFGAKAIRRMKAGGWLINTSRGELIDEQALLTALETGRISGAALDVLQNEHMLLDHPNPLVAYATKHTNLIITPHIGGCTVESMQKTEVFMAEKLQRLLQAEVA
jgi:D-3-phosphoglycerate dehydrogenase / 2-oxoglutarate reductase